MSSGFSEIGSTASPDVRVVLNDDAVISSGGMALWVDNPGGP